MREADIICQKYKNYPLDLYGPEAEAHLALIHAKLPSVAASLRTMREKIAAKRVSRPVYGEQTEIRREVADKNIPALIKKIIEDGPLETQASKALGDALDDKTARVIFLHGPSGSGKTTAACWYLDGQVGGRFVAASHLAALSEKLQGDRAELYALEKTRVLVIDDCGRGGETDIDQRKIGDFICRRADEGLLTICTSLIVPAYGESLKRRSITKLCSQKVKIEEVII